MRFRLLLLLISRSLSEVISLMGFDVSRSSRAIRVIFGTMGIPNPMEKEAAYEAIQAFKQSGHSEIDTAIMYDGGKTEETLGEMSLGNEFSIAVKVNPWYRDGKTFDDPVAGLQRDQLKHQFRSSLRSLKAKKVSLCYLHAPDHSTPIEETLHAMKELYDEGSFDEWGLSNYSSWQVVDIFYRSKEIGLKPPLVYQGMYNAVTRAVESELLPALRHCNMRFYAYNPLAGGLLTGKWMFENKPSDGRFSTETLWGNRYRSRYWRKSLFDALEKVKEKCCHLQITTTEASLRWLMHHSMLRDGDGLIIGGSSLFQRKENIAACDGGPLPDQLVKAFNDAWEAEKSNCPLYFR